MTDNNNPDDLSNQKKKLHEKPVPKITIICSVPDPASQNIKNHLLNFRKWEHIEIPENCDFSAVLPASIIIFASKHSSKEKINSLTVHCTGNPSNEVRLGGRPKELAVPSPAAMKSILQEMKLLAGKKGMNYDITLEVTHHGPTELSVPSLYVEIGSTENEWKDTDAGEVVAKAILAVSFGKVQVAIGFGGGHYAIRQTGILLETAISFGHNFPKYQLNFVDETLIMQAVKKSNADFAYFDRKSMKSGDRNRISAILKKLGIRVIKESEIREQYGNGS